MEENKTYSGRISLEILNEKNPSRKKFLEQILELYLKGKEDALKGNKPEELRKAYIRGYSEGRNIKEETIEQRWYD